MELKGLKFIIFSALLTVFLGTYFYYKAMSKSKSTTLVVLISYVLPLVIITLISHYLLKEKRYLFKIYKRYRTKKSEYNYNIARNRVSSKIRKMNKNKENKIVSYFKS